MTTRHFLKALVKLDQDIKIILNDGHFSELEIRLFLTDNSPRVSELVDRIIDKLVLLEREAQIDGAVIKDIVYHHHHFKEQRFYELVTD